VRAAHGADALAVYQGNPTVHNLGLMTLGQLLFRTLGTRNCFSSSSVDQLPHMVAAHLMFGDGVMIRFPISTAPSCSCASVPTRWLER